MSLKHFSHDHPLILMKEVVTNDGGDGMLCYACHQPIVPSSPDVAAAGDGADVYICGGHVVLAGCGDDCDNDGISNDDSTSHDDATDDEGEDDDGISNDDSTSNDDTTSDDDGEDDDADDSTSNDDDSTSNDGEDDDADDSTSNDDDSTSNDDTTSDDDGEDDDADDSTSNDDTTSDDDDAISNDDSTSNDDTTSDDDGEDNVAISNDDSKPDNNGTCGDFYLHRKCAELQREIHHPMHNRHPLTLQIRPDYEDELCSCIICGRDWKWFTYSCDSCDFDVCLTCAAVGDRSFWHIGHREHNLTLMQRGAVFTCDACGTRAEDSSYACNSCEFWMHKTCALSPPTVDADFIHKHPLVLTYSLPDLHRTFFQKCRICYEMVHKSYWLYYCDECTYFAHIKCIGKKISNSTETEPQKEDMDEDDLVRFPVDSTESFIHVMIEQFSKGNINLEKREGAAACSTSTGDHPQTLIANWRHKDHPLELLQELVGREQVEIICNGCIQPITHAVAHPFYGCIQCNFFLHEFCFQLPPNLPAGACSYHTQHPLVLCKQPRTFYRVPCAACTLVTNGFYYWCEKCDIQFDIRCSFLPNRIKHNYHNHPLLHSAPSHSLCDACGLRTSRKIFKCERSCNFQIHQRCALLPGTMRHRWDPHPIPLIYPPFDHQGLIYCEICEDQIDTNYLLYHCHECDHSFHTYCLRPRHNMMVGDNKLLPGLHKHTLTFVNKKKKDHHLPFVCSNCNMDLGNYATFVFECVNCDMLFCVDCVSSHL